MKPNPKATPRRLTRSDSAMTTPKGDIGALRIEAAVKHTKVFKNCKPERASSYYSKNTPKTEMNEWYSRWTPREKP